MDLIVGKYGFSFFFSKSFHFKILRFADGNYGQGAAAN
jgi:hypothetical protein